jgi:hypothetical protein
MQPLISRKKCVFNKITFVNSILIIFNLLLGKAFGDCSFQYSMCDWKVHTRSFDSNAIFPWEKKTGAQLEEGQILGPETDHNYDNSRNFILPLLSHLKVHFDFVLHFTL